MFVPKPQVFKYFGPRGFQNLVFCCVLDPRASKTLYLVVCWIPDVPKPCFFIRRWAPEQPKPCVFLCFGSRRSKNLCFTVFQVPELATSPLVERRATHPSSPYYGFGNGGGAWSPLRPPSLSLSLSLYSLYILEGDEPPPRKAESGLSSSPSNKQGSVFIQILTN